MNTEDWIYTNKEQDAEAQLQCDTNTEAIRSEALIQQ